MTDCVRGQERDYSEKKGHDFGCFSAYIVEFENDNEKLKRGF